MMKRRSFKRRMRIQRPTQSKYNLPVHFFKRKCNLGTVQTGSGGYVGALQTFALNLLPNYTELTALYDQYAIRYVKYYIVMRPTTLTAIESVNNYYVGMPNIIAVRDYDSSTVPSSDETGYNLIREY